MFRITSLLFDKASSKSGFAPTTLYFSHRRDYSNARREKEGTAGKEKSGKRAKSFSRARERREKSYRTRWVFEVGCLVALIELAISGRSVL